MKIHHVGYAVSSINKAKNDFSALGFEAESEIVCDKGRNINIMFMTNGMWRIELIEPYDKSLPSPVDIQLENQRGGSSPYHICYEVSDIELEIKKMLDKKFVLSQEPENAPAICNRMVAFLYKRSVGLVELLEI